MGSLRTVEMDMAHFTALLITETMEALTSSAVQQQVRLEEMKQAAAMRLEEFIRAYISEEMIDEEELQLFGVSAVHPGFSAVASGEPYTPAAKEIAENPPIYELSGLSLHPGDFEETGVGQHISVQGNARIRQALASRRGSRYQEQIKAVTGDGIPRVQVEGGRIAAKLAIRLEECGSEGPGRGQKMVVRPFSLKNPEVLSMKAGLTSEIEVTFKTIY